MMELVCRTEPVGFPSRLKHDHVPLPSLIMQSGIIGCLLWLWPIVQALIMRKRDVGAYAAIDASAMVQIAFAGTVFGALLYSNICSRPVRLRLLGKRPLVWLFLYVILCGFSSCWSLSPLYSAWLAIECAIFLLAIVAVAQRFKAEPNDFLEWIVYWALFAASLHAIRQYIHFGGPILFWRFSRWGSDILGPVACLSLFSSKRRRLTVFVLALCIFSTSTKTYVGLLLGALMVAVFIRSALWPKVITLLVTGLLLMAFLYKPTSLLDVFFPGKSEAAIITATGRLPVWRGLIDSTRASSPLIGRGFSVAERSFASESGSKTAMAHNSVIAAFSGTGLVGAFLIICLFADFLILSTTRRMRPDLRPGLAAAAVMSTFVAMFNPGVGGRVDGPWLSTVMLIVLTTTVVQGCSESPRPASYDTSSMRSNQWAFTIE